MALGWKWVATVVVLLLYYAVVLVWLAWEFKIPVLGAPRESSFLPLNVDDHVELRHHFDNLGNVTSWYNSSTVCKGYLLEGAAFAEDLTNVDTTLDVLEWRGGQWFYPPEASNPKWSEQHRMLRPMYGVELGHETRFSVSQATHVDDGVEWGNLTHLIRTIEGHLILQDFWDNQMYMEYMSSVTDFLALENGVGPARGYYQVDHTQVRNLKILLLGAFINTGMDRRVCMTGCANRSDLSNQHDCGFVLKMTYPNRRTLTTGRIEAELSSARTVDDPLYFPAFRIIGPGAITESEYDFRSEEFLRSALNMTGGSGNLDGPSRADPQDLATYLERSGLVKYKAVIAPTLIEQTQFKRQGKVVVGPFSTPYYGPSYSPKEMAKEVAFPEDLAEVELTLKFKNIVSRASNFSGRVLVRGSMTSDISWNGETYTSYVEQRPFSVEGIWDTTSEELCMIGCRIDSLNPNLHQNYGIPGTGCDWKICIQSVLRRFVSIDSPLEGAVVSSLYADAQQPGYFTSVRFMRDDSEPDPNYPEQMTEMARLASLTTYRYTVVAKAEELAKMDQHKVSMSNSLEEIDKRWFHPRYPTPYDVGDFCKASDEMRSTMSSFGMKCLYNKEGRQSDVYMGGFRIMYLESCSEKYSSDYQDGLPYDTVRKTSTPGLYLKVAVQLNVVNISMPDYQSSFYGYALTPWQCGAEGVYVPFTGKMHLVVHLRRGYLDGAQKKLAAPVWPLQRIGGPDGEVEDHEIYMKLQFPSIDGRMSTAEEEALDPDPGYSHQDEYIHRYKVHMSIESLRPKLDPLYFAPFQAKTYPLYKLS